MGILKAGNIQKLDRVELIDSYDFICSEGNKKQLLIIGESGNGKTQFIRDIMSKIHDTPGFDEYVYLHFDAKLFDAAYTKESLYNMLIYNVLRPREFNHYEHTQLSSGETFLDFLELNDFKEDIKRNIKKTLIASLTLIPQIGNLIYSILNVSVNDTRKHQYVDNQLYFFQYLNYIADKVGCFIIIDNVQNIPDDMLSQFYNHINQINNNIYLIVSNTIDNDKSISHNDILKHSFFESMQTIILKSFSREEFIHMCEKNVDFETMSKILSKIEFYYSLTQHGNLRQLDEFFFRIQNYGLDNIKYTPTLQSVIDLDEIKKDILHLTSIFPTGIKQTFIEKIVKYHCACSKTDVILSLSSLCESKYIVETDNKIFKIEHEKISEASREILGLPIEEEQFGELISICEKIFTEQAYQNIDDGDFVFCINAIFEIAKKFNLMKHMGIVSKYIALLHDACYYSQICNIYSRLKDIELQKDSEIILLFPLITILNILDAHQKNSDFQQGLSIVSIVDQYYNVNLYHSKFLLQTYHYDDALNVLSGKKTNYEAWSIYLNTLQHMREDKAVYNAVCELIKNHFEFEDIEFYYVILRNSGHLFKPALAKQNISKALTYFQVENNEFAEATCFNNLGIIYLYENPYDVELISEARANFKQAKQIMHKLDSNEEYQSLFNIGLSYTCEKKYSLAIDFYEKSKKMISNNLSFDIYKIDCNISLCKYLNRDIDLEQCINKLLDNYIDIEEIPDKWLKLQYDYNLTALRNLRSSKKQIVSDYEYYPGDLELYGLYLDINTDDTTQRFLFAVSPHWRY